MHSVLAQSYKLIVHQGSLIFYTNALGEGKDIQVLRVCTHDARPFFQEGRTVVGGLISSLCPGPHSNTLRQVCRQISGLSLQRVFDVGACSPQRCSRIRCPKIVITAPFKAAPLPHRVKSHLNLASQMVA
jgi:hypothetical protein